MPYPTMIGKAGRIALSLAASFALTHSAFAEHPGLTLLKERCQSCHGSNGNAAGRLNINETPQELAQKNLLVPGSPSESLIHQKIADGVMPLGTGKKFNDKELAAVTDWIKSLPTKALSQNTVQNNVPLTYESAAQVIRSTLNSATYEERRSLRFFSLLDLKLKGATPTQLQLTRQALAKTINSISWRPNLISPRRLDPEGLILAVNIRDLGWSLDLWKETFQNSCAPDSSLDKAPFRPFSYGRTAEPAQALKNFYDYSERGKFDTYVYYSKEEEEQIKQKAQFEILKKKGLKQLRAEYRFAVQQEAREQLEQQVQFCYNRDRTNVKNCDQLSLKLSLLETFSQQLPDDLYSPDCEIVPTDFAVATLTQGNVYRNFLLQDGRFGKTDLPEFMKEFFDEKDSGYDSAGFLTSKVSLHNRVILRKQNFKKGYFWGSKDFAFGVGKSDISRDANAKPDGGEYIFSLPNGMQAYFITNARKQFIDEATTDIVRDPLKRDGVVSSPASCFQCHGNVGIIPRGASEALKNGFSDFRLLKPMFEKDGALYRSALQKISADRNDSIEPVTEVLRNVFKYQYQ